MYLVVHYMLIIIYLVDIRSIKYYTKWQTIYMGLKCLNQKSLRG